MRMALCVLLGTGLAAQVAVPTWVDAGPMLGHVDHESVRVWIRVDKGIDLAARASVELADGSLRAVVGAVESRSDRVRLVHFRGLPAAAKVTIQLSRDRAFQRGAALQVRTAPPPAAAGTVRIALGRGPATRALDGVVAAQPDCFVFVGTTVVYSDSDVDKNKRLFERQMGARRLRGLQPLLRAVPTYATWDGHDFTPGSRKKARRVFEQMWANPAYGTAATKGVFGAIRRGPVELFLLDSHYERKASGGLGPAQLQWLIAGLQSSSARVRVVVAPMLTAADRQRLDAAIREQRIQGVLVLVGDDVAALEDGFTVLRVQSPSKGAATVHIETRDVRNRLRTQRNHRLSSG